MDKAKSIKELEKEYLIFQRAHQRQYGVSYVMKYPTEDKTSGGLSDCIHCFLVINGFESEIKYLVFDKKPHYYIRTTIKGIKLTVYIFHDNSAINLQKNGIYIVVNSFDEFLQKMRLLRCE